MKFDLDWKLEDTNLLNSVFVKMETKTDPEAPLTLMISWLDKQGKRQYVVKKNCKFTSKYDPGTGIEEVMISEV